MIKTKLTHEQEVVARIKQSPVYTIFDDDINALSRLVYNAYCEHTDEVTFICRCIETMREKQIGLLNHDSYLYKHISKETQSRDELKSHTLTFVRSGE